MRGRWGLALTALLLLGGCGRREAAAPPGEPPREEVPAADHLREDRLLVGETSCTIRRVGVDLDWPDAGPVLDRVEVYLEGDRSAPAQTFADFRGDAAPPLNGELLAEDLNFDGWTDFRIFRMDYRGNETWYCWLWDPAAAFFYDEALSGLRNPVWVPGETCVYTAAYAGMGGSAHAVYGWEDGAFVCLRAFAVTVHYLEPPFAVEAVYSVRREGGLQAEWTWRGDASGAAPGDPLVPPEADAFLEQVTPPEHTGQ